MVGYQLDDSQSLHRKWLFHQTSIYKWLFGVPGSNPVANKKWYFPMFSQGWSLLHSPPGDPRVAPEGFACAMATCIPWRIWNRNGSHGTLALEILSTPQGVQGGFFGGSFLGGWQKKKNEKKENKPPKKWWIFLLEMLVPHFLLGGFLFKLIIEGVEIWLGFLVTFFAGGGETSKHKPPWKEHDSSPTSKDISSNHLVDGLRGSFLPKTKHRSLFWIFCLRGFDIPLIKQIQPLKKMITASFVPHL